VLCSIVIPAHDEAATVGRALESLRRDPRWEELDVVVVCNGCTDGTAHVARSFGPPVRVVETPLPSKSAALNLGDRMALAFPRVYMDADVAAERGCVSALVEEMAAGGLDVAAPAIRFDATGAWWPVRAYHRVWQRCPHFGAGHVGAGLYALSEHGRQRFGDFPADALPDDLFVMRLFAPGERGLTTGTFSPLVPRTLRDILRVRRRHYAARRRLRSAARAGEIVLRERPDAGRRWLVELLRDPRMWAPVCVFSSISVTALAWSAAPGTTGRWHRDASSRMAIPQLPAPQ